MAKLQLETFMGARPTQTRLRKKVRPPERCLDLQCRLERSQWLKAWLRNMNGAQQSMTMTRKTLSMTTPETEILADVEWVDVTIVDQDLTPLLLLENISFH